MTEMFNRLLIKHWWTEASMGEKQRPGVPIDNVMTSKCFSKQSDLPTQLPSKATEAPERKFIKPSLFTRTNKAVQTLVHFALSFPVG